MFQTIGPKASGSGNCLPKYPGFEFDVFNLIKDYFTNMEEPIISFKFYKLIMLIFDCYSNEKSKQENFLSKNLLQKSQFMQKVSDINLPSNCVYETAFSGKEPVTKIVSIDELSVAFPNLVKYFSQSSKDALSMANHSKNYESVISTTTPNSYKTVSTMPRNSKIKNFDRTTPKLNQSNNSDLKFTLESPPEAGEYMLNKDFNLKKFYSLRKNTKLSYVDILPESRSNKENKYYNLMQLILLLLPSSSRRHLHLLIRVFYKIIRNKDLCLLTKDSIALKEYVSLP